MKTNVIAVATPTLGVVAMPWAMSLMDMQWPLNCTRTVIPVEDRVGGEIAETRNYIVKMALDYETDKHAITHLFFLDDDVLVPRACLLKLLNHRRQVASGVYFTKSEVGEPLIFPGPGDGASPFMPDEELESWGWSMGLSLISLEVFKMILKEVPDLPKDKYGHHRFFHTPSLEDATFVDGIQKVGGTEDFPFFQLCEKVGVKPVVDCSKYTFGWHYDKDRHTAYPAKQWDQYAKQQDVVWNTPKGEVVWKQG